MSKKRVGAAHALAFVVAFTLAFGIPSACRAQTLSLGQAGQFDVFAASGTTLSGGSSAGSIYSYNTTIDNNVGLGAGTSFNGTTSIFGSVTQDTGTNFMATGPVVGGFASASLSAASSGALNAASTFEHLTSSSLPSITVTNEGAISGSNFTFSATAGVNVFNITSMNLAGGTITLNQNTTSNQLFIFNVSGGLSLTNEIMKLVGVNPNNVIFNITGGSVGIGGTNIAGSILNMSGGGMSLDSDSISGSVISNGFIDMSSTVFTPELPTIAMAGFACLFLLAKGGLDWRRKRAGQSVP